MKLCISLLLWLAACSSFGDSPESSASSSGSPDTDGGSSSGQDGSGVTGVAPGDIGLTPIADRAFVVQGSFVDIPIHVVRGSMANGAVDISVAGAPTGVTIAGITIPANSSDGTLRVVTTGDAKQASIDLDISGDASGAKAVTKLPIFVRGAAGTLDTTFAPDALAIAVASNDSTHGRLTPLSDGSMIVSGTAGAGGRLVKVDGEGKSVANTNLGVGPFVAPLPDGRLLNFGNKSIERFSDKLVLDTAFGIAGSAPLTLGSNPSVVDDVAVVDGKVLVVSQQTTFAAVTRWTADGAPDTGFAACGVTCQVNGSLQLGDHPLVVDDSGQARVFIACSAESINLLMFGCGANGGRNLGADEGAGDLQIFIDNKFATSFPSATRDSAGGYFVVGRGDATVTLLMKVSAAGAAVVAPFSSNVVGEHQTVAMQTDRSLLVANGLGAGRLLAVRRFKPDGTEDVSFAHAEFGAGVKYVYGIAVQKDGRIIILTSDTGQMVLLRLWS